MAIGIYQIKNKENGLIYIGSSNNIKRRWKDHIKKLNTEKHENRFLQKDWTLFGKECFEFEILEECSNNSQFIIEQEYLNKFMPFYRNGRGYNINENSLVKNKASIRIFKNTYSMKNPFYGMSEEEMFSLYNSHYKHETFLQTWDINTEDKYLRYDLEGDICVVKPFGMKERFLFEQEVDNMTLDELYDYCCGLEESENIEDYIREELMDEYFEI